jgi:hypothetical protein
MRRPLRVLAVAAVLALGAAGCGGPTSIKTTAETEGIYLDLGGLKYQEQMSRYMNPSDVEDRAYLAGLPTGVATSGKETWFGVFMRVQNETDRPLPVATRYEIVDTQNNVYRPVPLDPKANAFAYQGGQVAPQSVLPAPDSAAGSGVIQGALVLFKVRTESLQNRPLEMRISGPTGGTATVSLDV